MTEAQAIRPYMFVQQLQIPAGSLYSTSPFTRSPPLDPQLMGSSVSLPLWVPPNKSESLNKLE